ncbi:hypothetical protein WJX72_011944 [[Myrmecia] bisecta]|uniref:Protein kinase domain-containing protein n=1 Tax=[Myrmecia] bisecta TaxID=41462 RepID=A0AAW1QA28_9CHLO
MDKARNFLHGSKSSQNLLAMQKREYPTSADEYELQEECGRGVSATVWRARCKTYDEIVAVKLLDLESVNCSLDEIIKEAQTMRQQLHPNVLPLHCSFVHQQNLWMVMPYVAGGSVLNIMKYAYSEGLEEPVIATILKEVLRGLDYMHKHGGIHRDVKAGNILIDNNGQVLLADFGVAATMERGGSWGNQQLARNTFVGTPCWMAPEVMEQTQGYNTLADIWSFGITILELAHGHAPFARFPPMKVLLMTIQNPPPTLESDSGKKHFSKAMRDIVQKCLVKDPTKRPTAAQLLEHKFFKTAHDPSYLVKHLLAGLPPVTERVRLMRTGKAPNTCVDNQEKMAQSQEAYVRGVSSWNFDVSALKASAASEGDSTPPGGLTPIAETPSVGLESGSSQQDLDVMDRISGVGTPSKDKAPPYKVPPKPGHKKQGRFEVYEGEAPPPMSPVLGNGVALMEQNVRPQTPESARPSTTSIDFEAGGSMRTSIDGDPGSRASDTGTEKTEKAKRKGRFQIVEDDFGDQRRPDQQRSVGRSASVSNMEAARGGAQGQVSPTSQPVYALLPPLKDVLEGMAGHYELMKELVAAVQDTERGKQASLNTLLQEVAERHTQRPSREEHEKVKAEVAHLKDDNLKLKDSSSHPSSRRFCGQQHIGVPLRWQRCVRASDAALGAADLPPEPKQSSESYDIQVFPRIKERDPYRRLGVSHEASFEEVQDARNFLYAQYKAHGPSREAIEMAFDSILGDKMKVRHKYGFKPPRTGRKTDAAGDALRPSLIQRIKDRMEPSVPKTTLVNDGSIFVALGIWAAWQSASADPTLPLGAAICFCAWRLFDKRRKRNPDGPYFGNSPLWGALGATVLGLVAGGLLSWLLVQFSPIPPSFRPEAIGLFFMTLILGFVSIFLK